jgi:hypothetical protein
MSNFGYHAITKIMPIAQIIGSFEILEHVIQNHLHEMPKCDVVKIVEKEKDPLISEKTMSNILDAIHQTEDIAQILRLNAYILLKAWIKEPSIIEDHWDALYHFVLELHRTDRASIFEKTDLQPLFQYKPAVLFALAFNCAIQTRTYYFVNFLSMSKIAYILDSINSTIWKGFQRTSRKRSSKKWKISWSLFR